MRKLRVLKFRGARTAVVALRGHVPAMVYGHRVLGAPPSMIARLRTDVSRALPGKTARWSVALRLYAHRADPALNIRSDVFFVWATAVWEEAAPLAHFHGAWNSAMTSAIAGTLKWQNVRGPAAAIALSMLDLGWKWPSPFVWLNAEGTCIDARRHCPRDIQAMARRDFQRTFWRKWTSRPGKEHLYPGPRIAPVQAMYARFAKRAPGVADAHVAKAFEGGLFTQANLAEALDKDDPTDYACRACLDALGTPQHRLYACSAFRAQRASTPRSCHHLGLSATTVAEKAHWERGLVADPLLRYPFCEVAEVSIWEHCDAQCFSPEADTSSSDNSFEPLELATDGSKIGTGDGAFATGWAISQVRRKDGTRELASEAPSLSGSMQIELPVQQRSGRAELVAALRALQCSEVPGIIWTDYQVLIDGIQRGAKWTTRAASHSADVWRQIWWKLNDFGGGQNGGWQFQKVKPHVTKGKLAKLTHSAQQVTWANERSDEGAKFWAKSDQWAAACRVAEVAVDKSVKMALSHIKLLTSEVFTGDRDDDDLGWRDTCTSMHAELAERVTTPAMKPAPIGVEHS